MHVDFCLSRKLRAATQLAVLSTSLFLSWLWPAVARAQAPSNEELERRVEALAQELEALQLGEVAQPLESRLGLAPAASKIYGSVAGVSWGGYGEASYRNFEGEAASQIDLVRQIVYFGYKFDDRVLFNSEIEFEHASSGKRGEVSVEFAYLDFDIHEAIGIRSGLLLVPMGFVNELHEPPVFFGVSRPEIERRIIPTTWRAMGAGVFGEPKTQHWQGLSYRAYLVESLASAAVSEDHSESFSASGLRGGRQKGSQALAGDLAGVVRLDYERRGVLVGLSAFAGNTAQGARDGSGEIAGRTVIVEGHAQYQGHGLKLRGLWVHASVDEVERLNAVLGLTDMASIGSDLSGWYAEAGYDVLHELVPSSRFQLVPYVRYSMWNTQDSVPSGFRADPALDQRRLTLGTAFYPHSQVVVKSDYEFNSNDADSGVNVWNLGVGFLF